MNIALPHPTKWLRRFGPVVNPRSRLVCFPHAGGAASFFSTWAGRLPADTELLAVRYPGREDRINEPCIEDMSEMAGALTQELAPLLSDGLSFFGHSMGAKIAFEVAIRLEAQQGRGPAMLFLSGAEGPGQPHRETVGDDDESLIRHIGTLGHGNMEVFNNPQLRALLLPPLRSDFRLVTGFDPADGRRTRVPLTIYTGDCDPGVSVAAAEAWRSATIGRASVKVFPGGHFFLREAEADLLADLVQRLPREARRT